MIIIIILRYLLLSTIVFYTGSFRNIKRSKKTFWLKFLIISFLDVMCFWCLDGPFFNIIEILILIYMFKTFYDINYTEAFSYSLIFYIIRESCYLLLSKYVTLFLEDVLKNLVAIWIYFIILRFIKVDISNFYNDKNIKLVLLMWFDLVSGLVLIDNFPWRSKEWFFLYLLNLIIIHFYNIDKNKRILVDKCDELTCYTSELETRILRYRKEVHEHRNELIMIRSLLEKDEYLKKYLATLIGESEDISVSELSNLNFPGVKNFIQYKVNDLKKIGCSLEIYVEPSLAKVSLNNFNSSNERILCIVLGVVLDNMIDACRVCDKKLISIVITKKENVIDGIFANYYENEVRVDELGNVGYTSKGMDRGIGLSHVKDVLKGNGVVSMKTELVDNFFVQHVYFDLSIK